MLIYNTPGTFPARGMGCGMLTPCLLSFVICHCHSAHPSAIMEVCCCQSYAMRLPKLWSEAVKAML